jgi:hypothetical protein
MKCPVCNGTGYIEETYKQKDYKKDCSFCFGYDLDWIEYIFGADREKFAKECLKNMERIGRIINED